MPGNRTLGGRALGRRDMLPGATLSSAPTGSARVVAEGDALWKQLVLKGAWRAKMIQAILVFNNHGKPRLVRFYQRFVSAAELRHILTGHLRPLLSLCPVRRTRASPADLLGLLPRICDLPWTGASVRPCVPRPATPTLSHPFLDPGIFVPFL